MDSLFEVKVLELISWVDDIETILDLNVQKMHNMLSLLVYHQFGCVYYADLAFLKISCLHQEVLNFFNS
jgi:hypothetical protein